MVRNQTSNFFGSQETSRKGSLWLVNEKKKTAHPSENHSTFSLSYGCLVYGESLWSSPGGFPSFPLRRDTQFYCGHKCTQLSTRIYLVYLLSIFEMPPIILTVKQRTSYLSESEMQGYKKSFVTVPREKFANSKNNFDRERQPMSVLQSIVLCTNH